MNRKIIAKNSIFILLITIICITYVWSDEKESKMNPDDTGSITGIVYDAETAIPIIGAVVIVEENGHFNEKRDNIDKTDKNGLYLCKSKIGHESKKFDVERALESSLIGIVTGAAFKKTKQIYVSQAIIKVVADGYNDFEGIVGVRNSDIKSFKLKMEPIYLTKKTSGEKSTVAVGWGSVGIVSCEIAPSVLFPKQKLNLSVVITYPDVDKKSNISIKVDSKFLDDDKIKKSTVNSDGNLVFNKEFEIKKKSKDTDYITISISNSPYYFKTGNESIVKMIQVINDSSEENAAKSILNDFEKSKYSIDSIPEAVVIEDANIDTAIAQGK